MDGGPGANPQHRYAELADAPSADMGGSSAQPQQHHVLPCLWLCKARVPLALVRHTVSFWPLRAWDSAEALISDLLRGLVELLVKLRFYI